MVASAGSCFTDQPTSAASPQVSHWAISSPGARREDERAHVPPAMRNLHKPVNWGGYWVTPSLTWATSMRNVPLSLNSRPLKRTTEPSASCLVLSSCVLESI